MSVDVRQLPAIIKREIPEARLPVNYEMARTAITHCERIDECKDWADKSIAIASYAKQLRDKSMLEAAQRIHLRARVRIGELLLEVPSNKKGKREGKSRRKIAEAHGVDPRHTGDLMAAARVPVAEREARIEASPPVRWQELRNMGRRDRSGGHFKAGAAYLDVVQAGNFDRFLNWSKTKDAAALAKQMTFDEAEHLRPKIQQATEWLDKLEQHLPKRAQGSGMVPRGAHNPERTGSIPAPATTKSHRS